MSLSLGQKKEINDRQQILMDLAFDTWKFNDLRLDTGFVNK